MAFNLFKTQPDFGKNSFEYHLMYRASLVGCIISLVGTITDLILSLSPRSSGYNAILFSVAGADLQSAPLNFGSVIRLTPKQIRFQSTLFLRQNRWLNCKGNFLLTLTLLVAIINRHILEWDF